MSRILAQATQLEWDQRREQGRFRLHRSQWIIVKLERFLPPEHVALAKRLAGIQARIEGCRVMDAKVDCAGNSAAIALDARLDAAADLARYVEAANMRVGQDGGLCVRGIAESEHMSAVMRRVGYPRGSDVTLRKLVQVTLLRLEEYDDETRGLKLCA